MLRLQLLIDEMIVSRSIYLHMLLRTCIDKTFIILIIYLLNFYLRSNLYLLFMFILIMNDIRI